MRHVVGLLGVAALSLMLSMGCGDQCQTAGDCNDENECTDDTCAPTGKCEHLPVADGNGCDFHGVQGVCVSGSCEESPCAGKTCDDDNECTKDSCDLWWGYCYNTDAPPGTRCDFDGLEGVCVYGVCKENRCFGVVCDDGDTCTIDLCDYVDGTCSFSPVVSSGQPCTSRDVPSGICIDGVCEKDLCPEMVCDDGDLCTVDSCLVNECRFEPKDCIDWMRCPDCEGGHQNVCTNDSCDPETGRCVHEPAPDGGSCCARWGPCIGNPFCICIPGPCPDDCHDPGHCQNGVCVAD